MKNKNKTKSELNDELTKLRQRVFELESLMVEPAQIEEMLRESDEKHRLITSTSMDGIYQLDKV
jgi:cell shape-determining protein MreC